MAEIDDDLAPNVRHSRYTIVESKIICARCSKLTAVFAFALPAGYESLNPADELPDDGSDAWDTEAFAAVVSYVGHLPNAVINRLRTITTHFRLDPRSPGDGFLKNHCEHCQQTLEEEWLHEDLDSPFGSWGAELSGMIQLHPVREPFEARVGGESHDIKPLDS